MQVSAALVAGSQSLELVEPGEGALDHPPGLAQAGTMGDAAPGDEGLDAALTQPAAVLVAVLSAVGVEPLGRVSGPASQSSYAGIRVEERYRLGDVVSVRAGQDAASGVPRRSTSTWCLEPGRFGRPVTVQHGPPLRDLTWEPPTAQSSISSRPAFRSWVRLFLSELVMP